MTDPSGPSQYPGQPYDPAQSGYSGYPSDPYQPGYAAQSPAAAYEAAAEPAAAPEVAPEETAAFAQQSAEQWYQHAAAARSLDERDSALQAAQQWQQLATERAAAEDARARAAQAAIGSELAVQPYPTQAYQEQYGAGYASAYSTGYPTNPNALPPKKRRKGLIIGLTAGLSAFALLVTALVVTVVQISGQNSETELQNLAIGEKLSTAWDAVDDQLEADQQLGDAAQAYNDAVADWDALQVEKEAFVSNSNPTPVPREKIVPSPGTAITPNDPTGRGILDAIGADADFEVIFDIGEMNCGYEKFQLPNYVYSGGCYSMQYGKVLFIGWDAEYAESGYGDFLPALLAHEYSHYLQWRDYYELRDVIWKAGYESDSAWGKVIETDASCRAVFEWGYADSLYTDSSSPCGLSNWTSNYLYEQAEAMYGITRPTEPVAADFEDWGN